MFFHTFFIYINDSQAHEAYSHYMHCSWFIQKSCFLRLKVYFKKVINTCSFYASMCLSAFDLLEIELCDFSICRASNLMTRVMSL